MKIWNILLNNLHAWNLRFLQYFNGKLRQISDHLLVSSRKLEINDEDGSFIFNVMIQLFFGGEEFLLNEMKITVKWAHHKNNQTKISERIPDCTPRLNYFLITCKQSKFSWACQNIQLFPLAL